MRLKAQVVRWARPQTVAKMGNKMAAKIPVIAVPMNRSINVKTLDGGFGLANETWTIPLRTEQHVLRQHPVYWVMHCCYCNNNIQACQDTLFDLQRWDGQRQ